MAYIINRYSGSVLLTVEDGTINSTLDLRLVGKNYPGYGEIQNENFVHLLENFSGSIAPRNPLSGQLWFDSSTKSLKLYDNQQWKSVAGSNVSTTPPTSLSTGDLWFDDVNGQLHVWSGTEYVLVGPQGVAGSGTTQMRSVLLQDSLGEQHAVIQSIVDGAVVSIYSTDEFSLQGSTTPVAGFLEVKKGVTLKDVDTNGVSSLNTYFWGTASDALMLGGLPASSYVSNANPLFTTNVKFGDAGITIGADLDLTIFVSDGISPQIKNNVSNTIGFSVLSNDVQVNPLNIVGNTLVPGNSTATIGSVSARYNNVYANTFDGLATESATLKVGNDSRSASVTASANTIAARSSSGDLTANVFYGVATSARYADLAEIYRSDAEYIPGTIMCVGGESEVTAATEGNNVIGVISTNPAIIMNADAEGLHVALKGRVPVRIIGQITKGDKIQISNIPGVGQQCASNNALDRVFAIALESCSIEAERLIECTIL